MVKRRKGDSARGKRHSVLVELVTHVSKVTDKSRLREQSPISKSVLHPSVDNPRPSKIEDSSRDKCWNRQVVLSLGKCYTLTNLLVRLMKRRWWWHKRSFRIADPQENYGTSRQT